MINKITPPSEGQPKTFMEADDTNIPALCQSVGETTARTRKQAVHSVLRATSDFVNELQLAFCRAGAMGNAQSTLCKGILADKLKTLQGNWDGLGSTLTCELRAEVSTCLKPKFDLGVQHGQQQAMSIVEGWGAGEKRTKDKSGAVPHGTFHAIVKGEGCFSSPTFGNIDCNAELADPVQKAFVVGWEQTMNTKTNELLHVRREAFKQEALDANARIRDALEHLNVPREDLEPIAQAAGRAVVSVIDENMQEVAQHATAKQREINRTLQPQIKERMRPGYKAAADAAPGKGKMGRMTTALNAHAAKEVPCILSESTQEMLNSIQQLINELGEKVAGLGARIAADLRRFYSASLLRVDDSPGARQVMDRATRTLAPMRLALDEQMAQAGLQ